MAEPAIDVGSLVMVNTRDGRSFRAQISGLVHQVFVIRYLDADGELVEGPRNSCRLFWTANLQSVATDPDGHPCTTIEAGWPEALPFVAKAPSHAA